MANFDFFTPRVEQKQKKSKEVLLTKHEATQKKDEYFSYMIGDQEYKYTGVFTKSGDSYIGKIGTSFDVPVDFHEGVEQVFGSPAFFTYMSDGKEMTFTGVPEFNEETNSYEGEIRIIKLQNEVIDIYPEN